MLPAVLTALDLDDDVLAAVRNGIRLFPVREGAGPVTPELVKELLEESV